MFPTSNDCFGTTDCVSKVHFSFRTSVEYPIDFCVSNRQCFQCMFPNYISPIWIFLILEHHFADDRWIVVYAYQKQVLICLKTTMMTMTMEVMMSPSKTLTWSSKVARPPKLNSCKIKGAKVCSKPTVNMWTVDINLIRLMSPKSQIWVDTENKKSSGFHLTLMWGNENKH